MLNVPVMGLLLAWLREFAEVDSPGHRAGLAGSMQSPALGLSYKVWRQLAASPAPTTCTPASWKPFYETDDEVAANVEAASNRSATPSARCYLVRAERHHSRARMRRCAPPTCSCSPAAR